MQGRIDLHNLTQIMRIVVSHKQKEKLPTIRGTKDEKGRALYTSQITSYAVNRFDTNS